MSTVNFRPPGPLCGHALGSDWIDTGTSCRARMAPPGPICTVASSLDEHSWLPTTELAASRASVHARERSGVAWVPRFPTSVALADLALPFRDNVGSFIAAIETTGGSVHIAATLRPAERAYLMHYCAKLATGGVRAAKIPPMTGVNIEWDHGNENKSQTAARAMRDTYEIVHPPALRSNHTLGLAIDMRIAGVIGKTVKDKAGRAAKINTGSDLYPIGKSYGVIKLVSDPPHWSHDGH